MKKFKKVYIEITNVCNLSCSFCPPTRRKPEFMTAETFKKILERIKIYTDYIYLHVKGEPLLHPEIDKLLEISHDFDYKVNLTTNGTRIAEHSEMLLSKPALRQISFSLQSLESEEFIQKQAYLTPIIEFLKKAVISTLMTFELRLWNLNPNLIEKNERNQNHQMLELIERSLDLPFEIEEIMNKGKGVKIADRIYLSQSNEFEWPDISKNPISKKGFCYGLRNQVAILVDGTVVPCCLDSDGIMSLGNIMDTEDFSTIINSNRANSIFEGFSRRSAVEKLCMTCGYRTRFD